MKLKKPNSETQTKCQITILTFVVLIISILIQIK